MLHLVRNNILCVSVLLLMGCATSTNKARQLTNVGTEIVASTDRVLVQCEYQDGYDGEAKEPYGFMMHILDDEKAVLKLIVEPVLEKKDCFEILDATNKILNNSKVVHIGSFSPLYGAPKKTDDRYTFPGVGTFQGNGQVLNYQAIWNDYGQCYDVGSETKKPCPKDDLKAP